MRMMSQLVESLESKNDDDVDRYSKLDCLAGTLFLLTDTLT